MSNPAGHEALTDEEAVEWARSRVAAGVDYSGLARWVLAVSPVVAAARAQLVANDLWDAGTGSEINWKLATDTTEDAVREMDAPPSGLGK